MYAGSEDFYLHTNSKGRLKARPSLRCLHCSSEAAYAKPIKLGLTEDNRILSLGYRFVVFMQNSRLLPKSKKPSAFITKKEKEALFKT